MNDDLAPPTEFAIGVQRRIFNWAFKRARLSKGYTMAKLAEIAGCHIAYLYAVGSFRVYPNERIRDRICIALEVSEEILFPSELRKMRLLKQPEPVAITARQLRAADLLALPAPSMEDEIDDKVGNDLLREQIEEILHTLDPRERKVLELRFGLKDGRSRTLEEVGREFGRTRERIRAIEGKALRKLRHPSRSRKLKDFLE